MNDRNERSDEDATREQLLARIADLRRQVMYDQLTGLANRGLFEDRLERARAYARRTRHRFALLVLDLDDFKEVNDRYGHEVGDAFLRATGQRLASGLRDSDTPARLGGDEFALLLFGADRPGAEHVARRLRVELSKTVQIGDLEVSTGVSIGTAILPDDATDLEELRRKADAAMYQDKHGVVRPQGTVKGALRRLGAHLRGPD